MKKILPKLAALLFGAFIVGMFGLVISLTFSALGRIFPDNFTNQIIGLVLFDIAALAWGMAFVYQSKSTSQYAVAAIGFLVGIAGTLAMIASEVMLSAEGLTTPPPWVGKALVYGFVICAALHLVLGYAHKAASPEVDASIRLGAAQAEITEEAIMQAETQLENNRAALGQLITPRLTAGIKRNLNLPVSDAEWDALGDAEIIEAKPKKKTGIPVTLWNSITGKRRKARKPVTTTYEKDAEGVTGASPAPFPLDQDEGQD